MLSENLAPICTPCNTKKGSVDYGHLPALLPHLRHAATVAPKVVKQVQRFAALNELGPALLKLLSADLDDDEIRTQLRSWLPHLLHTAVSLDPDAIGDVVARRADLDLGLHNGPVTLAFAWRTIAAVDLLEKVAGTAANQTLEPAVYQLVVLMCRAVKDDVDGQFDPHGPVCVGPAEPDDVTVTLTAVTFARTATSLDLAFTGTLNSQVECALTHAEHQATGFNQFATAEAAGRFSVAVSCELADPPSRPEITDVRITSWKSTIRLGFTSDFVTAGLGDDWPDIF